MKRGGSAVVLLRSDTGMCLFGPMHHGEPLGNLPPQRVRCHHLHLRQLRRLRDSSPICWFPPFHTPIQWIGRLAVSSLSQDQTQCSWSMSVIWSLRLVDFSLRQSHRPTFRSPRTGSPCRLARRCRPPQNCRIQFRARMHRRARRLLAHNPVSRPRRADSI
jgi:hypothetical protein